MVIRKALKNMSFRLQKLNQSLEPNFPLSNDNFFLKPEIQINFKSFKILKQLGGGSFG